MRPLAAALAAALVLAPSAAAKLPLGFNLLRNPGAEQGPASPNGELAVAIPGWTDILGGSMTVVQYGGSNGPPNSWVFPPASESQRINGGAHFFAGGPRGGTLTQVLDVGLLGSAIDSGVVTGKLSAWLGGYLSQTDPGTVDAQFYDNGSTVLGHVSIGPVTPPERGNDLRFVQKSAAVRLARGTRRVVVVMSSTLREGGYADSYFDNLAFVLTAPKPKPPALTIAQRCVGVNTVVGVSARAQLTSVSFYLNGQQRGKDVTKPFGTAFLLQRPAKLKVVAAALVTGLPVNASKTVRLRACS